MKSLGRVFHARFGKLTQAKAVIAGLPAWIALLYAALFAIMFWLYSAMWPNAPIIVPDSPSYVRAAQDLSDFRVDQLNSRPPAYPLLLVITGFLEGTERALFHTSLAFHFISVWLLGALLYGLGVNAAWLILFLALLMLPPYVEYAAYVLADNLTTFFLVVAFASLVFWFRRQGTGLVLLSGLAIACSALTRPTYQLLSLVCAGSLLVVMWAIRYPRAITYRSCVKAGSILLITSAVLIGGYSYLNHVKFGFFGIYPMTGFNLSTRTVKFLERLPDQYAAEREALIKARDAEIVKRGEDHTGQLSYWKAVPDLERITGLKAIPDLSQYLLRLHLLLISEAPLTYLQEVFASFSSYWLPSATDLANMNSLVAQTLWASLHFGILSLFLLQLIVITGFGLFQLSKRLFLDQGESLAGNILPTQAFAYLLAGMIVLYNAVATAMTEVGDPRYRTPTEPLIVFMSFLGFLLWRQLLARTEIEQISSRDQ